MDINWNVLDIFWIKEGFFYLRKNDEKLCTTTGLYEGDTLGVNVWCNELFQWCFSILLPPSGLNSGTNSLKLYCPT